MRILLLTNEYPPHVYGGAGVHVEYLTREMCRQEGGAHEVSVLCFGDQDVREANLTVRGVAAPAADAPQQARHAKLFDTLGRNLVMAAAVSGADIIHCHTWYSHWAGCLLKQLTGARLVLTTHSLEPHRPWKAEQLGTAYRASTWIEKTAYENADGVVAVSPQMREDVLKLYDVAPDRVHVIPNGIDPDEYRPTFDEAVLRSYGIDPARPFVLFVGRITRQKGIIHLVDALHHLIPGTQVVLAAGAPDTPEIEREMTEKVEEARQRTSCRLVWIRAMMPRAHLVVAYSHAALFVCPSVYEPFGIINLEAMACETAVVATSVGGIPTVVSHGETGLLVPLADDPAELSLGLAEAINALMQDASRRDAFARQGRRRVKEDFSWSAIAARTLDFYRRLD